MVEVFFQIYLEIHKIFDNSIFHLLLYFSEMYTANPDEACLFIPSVDTLNFKRHRDIHTFVKMVLCTSQFSALSIIVKLNYIHVH